MKSLKKKLENSEVTIGSWIAIDNTSLAEIMAKAGFNWLTVDMEHSAITLSGAQKLIQVIELSGVIPLARVGENNPNLIKRVMDAGAHGVIVPMVNNKESALSAVSAVKYPPLGSRGVGLARAQGYGFAFEKYKEWAGKESVVIVQIEHRQAIENLEDILTVEGVDASIIGPYDLSASLGYPGEYERPKVKEAIQKYESICDKLNKPKGIHVVAPSGEEALKYLNKGYKFLGFSTDFLFLGSKCREELAKVTTETRK